MKRRSILSISAVTVLGLALVPSGAVAQQGTLRQQLVGAWTLVSCNATFADGTKRSYCTSPNGILILDASGRYATVYAARGRPKYTLPFGSETKAEEFKAASLGVLANFGTWSVNEADKTMTRHFDGAAASNFEGTDAKASVSLAGDELTLVGQPITVLGAVTRSQSVYRRVR
jgi:hypothetical protein